jgi:ubiquinone/menaquinone biosynthesis C-methylase UbiE/YHS domain-containing protein
VKDPVRRFLNLIQTPPRSARAAYDAVAAEYDGYERAWRRVAGERAFRRVEAVLRERLPRGGLVLDAGIGTGAISARVLAWDPSARVVGLDLSPGMLRMARAKLAGGSTRLVEGDMTRLPFASGVFDAVVSTWALETLPRPRLAVGEMLRVLGDSGVVVCAFSSAATDPIGAVEERLLRRPLSEFAGRFLADRERPMHWCGRSSLERYDHGLTSVIVLGKCCTIEEYGPCVPPESAEGRGDRSKERAGMATDPVCKMDVDEGRAAATSEHQGQTFYFCAPGCKRAFDKEPERYLSGTNPQQAGTG